MYVLVKTKTKQAIRENSKMSLAVKYENKIEIKIENDNYSQMHLSDFQDAHVDLIWVKLTTDKKTGKRKITTRWR